MLFLKNIKKPNALKTSLMTHSQKSIPAAFIFLSLVILTGIFAAQDAIAQTKAKLVGKVTDKDSGEELIGASVTLIGKGSGSLTNVDGEYTILVEPGTYDIRISYVGYQQVIKQVKVVAPVTRQDVQLKTEQVQAEEIVVQADIGQSTENALLTQQRKSSSISDAISAEFIKKTPDSDAGEAAKRVTGISVVGGKYVFVRGLGERYSSTQLNGINIPSPEPEKKVVPFDIIPANLLDNMVTLKTFLPDQPGNFAGGLVKIKTKEFPDEFQFNVGVSGGFNNRAHFVNILDYPGSATDWLGFDNGSRALPRGLPSIEELKATSTRGQERARVAGLFNNGVFEPRLGTYAPNQSYSIAFADRLDIGVPLGYIASLTYSSDATYKDQEIVFPLGAAPADPNVFRYQYNAQTSLYTVNLGGILHFNVRLDDNNKLGLKGTYNRSAEDETRSSTGVDILVFPDLQTRSTRLRFLERELFSAQLVGNHYLGWLGKAEFDWTLQYATAARNEPDNRETLFAGEEGSAFSLQNFRNQRFFASLFDRQYDVIGNLSFPFTQWDGLKSKFKIGGLYSTKSRAFDARRFSYRAINFGNIFGIQPDRLFTPEQVAAENIEFVDDTQTSDAYTARETTSAGYLMLELPLTGQLRFVGGVRVENNTVNADANRGPFNAPEVVNGGFNVTNILPSVNFIYSVGEQMNFRAAFSQTVAQPEMRELAPFRFDDYVSSTLGNPFLEQTRILNFDLRWEWFPRFNELIAISVFYKDLLKPLERIILDDIGTNPFYTTINGQEAQNVGAEFEVRKSLDFLTSALKDFSVSVNLTLVRSRITQGDRLVIYNESIGRQESPLPPSLRLERPLQGQSDYVFNATLGYFNQDAGITATLLYNIVGRRIVQLSGSQFILDNFIEEPRNQLDFSASKSFGRNFTIKLNVKNIIDDRYLTTILGRTAERYNIGRIVSLSLSYQL
ncbi:MAG: hypothetical protein HY22_04890 [[Candidatus Thermochlorobacteriaceae] bacterium GBChlB]|nr:MAG: hypothetical protein HY22_04890 [[Candidatus Thermochlorobacteriaceae] bacterium GBChlB]